LIDRPDIVMRFYADKVREVHKDLIDRKIFGKQLGYAESMEFQKRGGPHFHRVMATDIPAIPEIIEGYILAHIPPLPDKEDRSPRAEGLRRLRELVIRHQLHDCKPDYCGKKNKNGKCSKFFPYDYSDKTILYDDQPAVHYRPSPEDGGEKVLIPKGGVLTEYTNAHVTPYNPFILMKYETHHNLAFCYGEKTNMKYTMKYPLKGPTFQYIQVQGDMVDIDEPAHYAQMYYRSANEAYARIHTMPYVRLSNTVYEMEIHLPGHQNVVFKQSQAAQVAAGLPKNLPKTMLTEYWSQWKEGKSWQCINKKWTFVDDASIKDTLYEHMPENYWYDKKVRIWKKRILNKDVIGLIYPRPSPRDQERFALYILLRHFPGDPEALKDVNGVQCTTFVEAARLRGLLSDDSVWERTLEEASHFSNPSGMRYLFVQVLVFGNPSNARELWERFVDHMFKPVVGNDPDGVERNRRIDRALAIIEQQLSDYGMTNQQFGLDSPSPGMRLDVDTALDNFFFGDKDEDDFASGNKPTIKLNDDQENVWTTVQNALQRTSSNTIFVTGDGGTGKTYLFNAIISRLRDMRIRVIASAYTGCAATLLTGGATVHSVFRFGINIDENYTPSVSMQSFHGKRISDSQVIIIDEVSMLPKHMLEAIDRVCKQMCPQNMNHLPFGGKVIILSGDFKQSLPVVAGGGMRDQVNACIQTSQLWPLFRNNIITLNINMRQGQNEIQFTDWLRRIGNGDFNKEVEIESRNLVGSRQELMNFISDNGQALSNPKELIHRLILAPHNDTVNVINEDMLKLIKTKERIYFSTDESNVEMPMDFDECDNDVEALNLLNPPSIPPHRLHLKEGCIVILLKNLGVSRGLVNGTRMIVKELGDDILKVEVVTGSVAGSGNIICLSRVWCDYEDNRPDGVKFRRLQFPVRLAYAMTIMKAQGQTATRVGLDLTHQVFGHGNLYTALSRVRTGDMFKVFAPHVNQKDKTKNKMIKNVVADGLEFF